jgi:hypothetical protein
LRPPKRARSQASRLSGRLREVADVRTASPSAELRATDVVDGGVAPAVLLARDRTACGRGTGADTWTLSSVTGWEAGAPVSERVGAATARGNAETASGSAPTSVASAGIAAGWFGVIACSLRAMDLRVK